MTLHDLCRRFGAVWAQLAEDGRQLRARRRPGGAIFRHRVLRPA
jgi:hypothetical protein